MSHLPCFLLIACQGSPAPKGHLCTRQKSLLGLLTRGGPYLLRPSSQSFSLQRQRENLIIFPKTPFSEALMNKRAHKLCGWQMWATQLSVTGPPPRPQHQAKQETQPKRLCKRTNKHSAWKHRRCCLTPTTNPISNSWVPALTPSPLLTKALWTTKNEYLKGRSTQSCCWLWKSFQHPQPALPRAATTLAPSAPHTAKRYKK